MNGNKGEDTGRMDNMICLPSHAQAAWTEKSCPVCGRLVFRNYNNFVWDDMQELEEEQIIDDYGNEQNILELFDSVSEEKEDDLSQPPYV